MHLSNTTAPKTEKADLRSAPTRVSDFHACVQLCSSWIRSRRRRSGVVVGIQHHPIPEPPMDPNKKMETADFPFEPSKHLSVFSSSTQLMMPAVVPQIAVNPWEDISHACVEVVTDYVQQEMYPHAQPSFLPRPSARSASRSSSRMWRWCISPIHF